MPSQNITSGKARDSKKVVMGKRVIWIQITADSYILQFLSKQIIFTMLVDMTKNIPLPLRLCQILSATSFP